MIGALKGKPQIFDDNTILMFVGGAGYKVNVNTKLIENLPTGGEEIFLYTHTHVKEDCLDLYGFQNREELALFEMLISVSGIGPKTALSALEKGEKGVREAVLTSDVDFFTSIPRIGRKNAQRIIIDLKSKIGSLSELDLSGKAIGQTKDMIEALTAMGFRKNEVQSVLDKLPKDMERMEDKIREALKMLGK